MPTAVGKRVDTCGFYPLNSRFPLFLGLVQTRDRRPLRKRGTAEDFCFRVFLNLFAVSDSVLLHRRFHLRRRDITVSRNSFARYYGRHLRILFDVRFYRRVRRPRRTVAGHLHTHNRRGGHWPPAPLPSGCGQTMLPLHDTFLFQNTKRYIPPEKFMLY